MKLLGCFSAGLACGLVLGVLVAPGSQPSTPAVDWSNPDNAIPAFNDTKNPHEYVPAEGTQCCAECGGGKNHPVHKLLDV